ncbi:hypothetical protein F511_10982 [Dorcoceras hygrometricum]|uniref:Uncharacterized protein n=1 Tax=Dorcoceras hygrometricum TaxID=472368 RepID=A0A2Z7CPM2_9LAMI|nr:hypothetical protein F511_10982 [Dorcoceras hygrometricum]
MGFLICNLNLVVGFIGGAYIAQNYDIPNIKDEIQTALRRLQATSMKPKPTAETTSTNPEPKTVDSS